MPGIRDRVTVAWRGIKAAMTLRQGSRLESFESLMRRRGPYPVPRDVFIDEHTALQISTAWRCVNVISDAIATSPKKVFERLAGGDHDEKPDDPLWWLLNRRPNPESTAISFWCTALRHKVTFGNAYVEIIRDMAGRPAQLWLISPDRVVLRRRASDAALIYEVRQDTGDARELLSANVMHFRGPGFVSFAGDNMISQMLATLALSASAEQFASNFFGRGTSLSGYLRPVGELDQVDAQVLKDEWERVHAGSGNAFRTAILQGVEWVDVPRPNLADAQAIPARQFQVEEICRFFGVPPTMVGHLGRATWSNVEQLYTDFVRSTLRGHAQEIEQEIEAKLFPARKPWRFVTVDMSWALMGDYKARAEGHRIMANIGALSVNDVLRAEGMNTIGKEGDVRLVNSAQVRLEDVGKTPPAPPPIPGAPEDDDPEGEDDEESSDDDGDDTAVAFLTYVLERFKARADAERRSKPNADAKAINAWLATAATKAAEAAALPPSMKISPADLRDAMLSAARGSPADMIARAMIAARF